MALELLFGGTHILCTVAGIFRLQLQQGGRIYLVNDEEGASHPVTTALKAGKNTKVVHDDEEDGDGDEQMIISPPDRGTIIRLSMYPAVLSLGASLPLNFAPKI